MVNHYLNKTLCWSLFFMLISSVAVTKAQFNSYAVGFNAGTNGFGIDATTNLTERLNLRSTFNFYSFNFSGEIDDDPTVEVSSKIATNNFSLLLHFHPYKSGFSLVTGIYYMDWSVDSKMIPIESYEVDGRIFEPDRLGNMRATLEYPNKIAPYLGLGFGNPIGSGSRIKFNLQIGAMYTGAPKLNMSGTGMIAPTADNQGAFQEGLNEFKWYPIMNLGLSYRI